MYLCYYDRPNQLPLTSTPSAPPPPKHGPSGYADGLKLLLMAIHDEDPCAMEGKSFPSSSIYPPLSWTEDKPASSCLTLPPVSWKDEKPLSSDDDKDSSPDSSPGRDSKTCTQCGATETPKWRRGMSEDGVSGVRLCNACGIRSKRLMRRKSPKSSRSLDKKRQKELKKAYLREKKSRQSTAYRIPTPRFFSLPPLIRAAHP